MPQHHITLEVARAKSKSKDWGKKEVTEELIPCCQKLQVQSSNNLCKIHLLFQSSNNMVHISKCQKRKKIASSYVPEEETQCRRTGLYCGRSRRHLIYVHYPLETGSLNAYKEALSRFSHLPHHKNHLGYLLRIQIPVITTESLDLNLQGRALRIRTQNEFYDRACL